MKKHLIIICALLVLTAFASCGEVPVESSKIVEEVILDSVFENDYIKISVNDDWEESTETLSKTEYINWSWENENSSKHNISLGIEEDYSGKVSLDDFLSAYNSETYIDNIYPFQFEKDNLIDSFEENNQTYVVTGSENYHNIFFKTNRISGKFSYSSDDEEIVIDMIESMEFKKLEIKTTTSKKEKTTKATNKNYIPMKTVTKASQPITEPTTTKSLETQPPVIETTPVQTTVHFILNLDTSCIHIKPDCSAAQKILPENYSTIDIAENDLGNYNGTYWACGKCCPNSYRKLLPKF